MPAHRVRSGPALDPSPLAPAAEQPERVLRAQLRCYLCSETCGALEASSATAMPSVARLRPVDGSPERVLAWARLRCPRCGGRSLFLDELETIVRRVEHVDWALERPRRGRPPAWLIALRKRQDAA